MAVNINRDVKDVFFRYKMPRLIAKVEGHGNGIKTVIPNMVDIAKSLSRPPTYPCKFFGIELGAQTQMDDTIGRYIVNGQHQAEDLSKLLDKFIKKFVLCGKCGNPETDMTIDKKQQLLLTCKACGFVTKADSQHRLMTFIINHPPSGGTTDGKAGKKSKEERRKEKAEKNQAAGRTSSKNNSDDEDGDLDPEDGGMQFTPGVTLDSLKSTSSNGGDSAAAAEPSSSAADLANTSAMTDEGGADLPLGNDEEFSVDEETLQRARESALGNLTDSVRQVLALEGASPSPAPTKSGDKGAEADPYDEFANYLASGPPTIEGVKEQTRFLDDEKAMAVLAQVLFDERVLEQITLYKDLLLKVATSEKSQKGLLGGLERVVGKTHPKIMGKMPHILKACYDGDILPEEVIIAWGKKPSKKYLDKETAAAVRKHAQPILDWLETAEEESDDDDDE